MREKLKSLCFYKCVFVLQPLNSAELSCSVRALQQDLEELKSVNASLRKENHNLREQLNAAKNGNTHTHRVSVLHITSTLLRVVYRQLFHSIITVKV